MAGGGGLAAVPNDGRSWRWNSRTWIASIAGEGFVTVVMDA